MSTAPSPTLFVQNLPNKTVKKPELRRTLAALFGLYGKVLDVVHTRAEKMRGSAFVVFRDLSSSTAAMRGLDGEGFFGKQLQISYARSVSHSTVLHTQGPEALYALKSGLHTSASAKLTVSGAQKKLVEDGKKKRARDEQAEEEEESDEDDEEDAAGQKKRKVDDQEEDDDAMEEDSDSETPNPNSTKQTVSSVAAASDDPSPVLFVQGLPATVTSDMLNPLFQQYPGLQSIKIHPSIPGTPVSTNGGIGFVTYETAVQAGTAKDVLDGFLLTKGISMKVSYAARS